MQQYCFTPSAVSCELLTTEDRLSRANLLHDNTQIFFRSTGGLKYDVSYINTIRIVVSWVTGGHGSDTQGTQANMTHIKVVISNEVDGDTYTNWFPQSYTPTVPPAVGGWLSGWNALVGALNNGSNKTLNKMWMPPSDPTLGGAVNQPQDFVPEFNIRTKGGGTFDQHNTLLGNDILGMIRSGFIARIALVGQENDGDGVRVGMDEKSWWDQLDHVWKPEPIPEDLGYEYFAPYCDSVTYDGNDAANGGLAGEPLGDFVDYEYPSATGANWTLTDSISTAQLNNTEAGAMFVSSFTILNQRVTGEFYGSSANSDDDFMGFVFGFDSLQEDYYLFSWKQQPQGTAHSGIALAQVYGWDNSDPNPGLWGLDNPDDLIMLREDESVNWVKNRAYKFQLDYYDTHFYVIISEVVSGDVVFSSGKILQPNLVESKIGFYSYSQAHTHGTNIRVYNRSSQDASTNPGAGNLGGNNSNMNSIPPEPDDLCGCPSD